jgi:hypothetical protein
VQHRGFFAGPIQGRHYDLNRTGGIRSPHCDQRCRYSTRRVECLCKIRCRPNHDNPP